MKAFLKNYRQSPRKVRLVADLVKGKDVESALTSLSVLPKRAALPLQKLVLSAIANAKPLGLEKENLFVKELRVDKGIVMKRFMPRAMGRASRINKRTSRVLVVLSEGKNTNKKIRNAKAKAAEKVTKKVVTEKKPTKKINKK